jgi:magnesium chelatase subunit I
VDAELTLLGQEARLVGTVPEHLLEVLVRFACAVRESPAVDQRSGVSARFPIAAAETVSAAALRRAGLLGEPIGSPGSAPR